LGILDPHPHHTKPTRHARQIIRRMLRRSLVRQHAGVLDAQSAALVHEVHRRDRGRAQNPLPGESRIAPGLKVRVGPENRALLRRMLAARNLREMQALAREIRHRVAEAIKRAELLRRVRKQAARKARAARTWFTGHARSGWQRAVPQRGKRETPAARQRTAPAAPVSRGRFSADCPARGRFERPARKPSRRRGRPSWTRTRAG
jgi:hypothetical protein